VAEAILARDLAAEASDPFLGAKRRHVADDAISSSDAETFAAQAALADAGVRGADVDLVLSYSIVPDRIGLPAGGTVAHRIGAQRALALNVESACATTVAQLEVARAYLESGMAKVVLLTQSHLLLRSFPLAHPASPGLGDAATALVLAHGSGLALRSTFAVSHGEYAQAVTWVRGRDDHSDVPWWKAGGNFCIGSRAPELTKLLMRDTVSFGANTVLEATARAGVDVERIAVLASVQPRGFMPGAIAERLGLPRAAGISTYDEIAHVGACGPVFNLRRARERGWLRPGALAAFYAQGAGFTRAAAVIQVTD
jgi:3-oxoacyl-[acyl-carrier-protein] synthase-3